MKVIRLLVLWGQLYFPTGGSNSGPSLLVRMYDAGDFDTCPWPMEQQHRKLLARALFDERETNETWLHNEDVIIELPDGTAFDFDQLVE